ncbi:hypothetical protein M9H77_29233 [Catharanthus roseus]|uniref:Uncharacterized protein n=1 Tax=Catharanthus roseus TaxID=4058 RepID=A0ACC0AJJ1_CATRO|nr:hypothetical protein M9H77_29233 [Catharanthus roseus]
MTDEDWVKEATGDDAMVAELLLRFKQQQVKPTESAAPTVVVTSKRALSVEWKVRQRRSKAVVIRQSNKNLQGGHRASPTTPLSWSGGATSISGVGGGASGSFGGSGAAFDGGHEEESSRPSPSPTPSAPSKRLDTTRSKVTGTSETASTKRSRKKKTLAELKEEEDLLQKERRKLKRDLATLRLNLEKAKATNENLKRIKLELLPPLASVSVSMVSTPGLAVSDQLQQKIAASNDTKPATLLPAGSPRQCTPPPNSGSKAAAGEEVRAGKFVLPDLNLPLEET